MSDVLDVRAALRALDFLAAYLLRHAGRGPVPGWHQVWVPSAVDSEAS